MEFSLKFQDFKKRILLKNLNVNISEYDFSFLKLLHSLDQTKPMLEKILPNADVL